MWDDLVRGAIGAVVLVDTDRLADCFPAVDYFEHLGMPVRGGRQHASTVPSSHRARATCVRRWPCSAHVPMIYMRRPAAHLDAGHAARAGAATPWLHAGRGGLPAGSLGSAGSDGAAAARCRRHGSPHEVGQIRRRPGRHRHRRRQSAWAGPPPTCSSTRAPRWPSSTSRRRGRGQVVDEITGAGDTAKGYVVDLADADADRCAGRQGPRRPGPRSTSSSTTPAVSARRPHRRRLGGRLGVHVRREPDAPRPG